MSARERFFKKVQQSSKNITSGNTSVEAEIVEFCERLEGLAQQIIEWFAGTSIEVTLSRQYLHDLSTLGYSLSSGICRYEIATILLQNGERSVSIVPEQLFRAGETGCVRMRVSPTEIIRYRPTQQARKICAVILHYVGNELLNHLLILPVL